MATNEEFQRRLRDAVREAVAKVLAEDDLPEGELDEALFTKIESVALLAGDAVSLEVFEQRLSKCTSERSVCPDCGGAGRRARKRERAIQTRRGLNVPLTEQECYCARCRRAFFPSVPIPRAGRGL
jgi:hypothetical protein